MPNIIEKPEGPNVKIYNLVINLVLDYRTGGVKRTSNTFITLTLT